MNSNIKNKNILIKNHHSIQIDDYLNSHPLYLKYYIDIFDICQSIQMIYMILQNWREII